MEDFQNVVKEILFTKITIGKFSLPFNLINLILQFILPFLLSIVFYRLILFGIKHLLRVTRFKESLKANILKWTRLVLRLLFFILLIIFITRLFGAEIFSYISSFYGILSFPLIANTRISLITIILTIPVFYIASKGAHAVQSFFDRTVFKPLDMEASRKFTLKNLIKYTVMAIIILVGLSIIGIDLSALTVIFGVMGIGIGFGLQNTISNFFSGLIIIFSRPIKEGDHIEVNQIEGLVVQIRMLSTVISTLTHESIIVPNSLLVNNTVHNFSYDDRRIILHNSVQVAYHSDLDQIIEILKVAVLESGLVLHEPEPLVHVMSFDSSGITITLKYWIADVSLKQERSSSINLLIWRVFKENGIEIPFPQLDLYVKKN